MKRPMKILLSGWLLTLALTSPAPADTTVITDVIDPFFAAMQAGDVQAIESYIGGQLAENTRVLLQKNTTYPDYLRRHYQGTSITVDGLTQEKADTLSANVTVNYPGGNATGLVLILKKDAQTGYWKIVDQLAQQNSN